MRTIIFSPDVQQRIDPPLHNIIRHFPNNSGELVWVVPITRLDNFQFHPKLYSEIPKSAPWVLVDMSEFLWNWDQRTSHRWGVDRLDHDGFKADEWRQLDDFILNRPPVAIFQRELLAADRTDKLLPIEYLNYAEPQQLESEEQFRNRPIDVLFNWGRSHESRPRFHADILRQSSYLGYSVVTEWNHIDGQLRDHNNGVWCAIHTPHFARIDVRDAMRTFNRAKIVVALNGAGVKTFRNGEIPNSIQALPKDNLAWGVELNERNALRLSTGIGGGSITHDRDAAEVREIHEFLKREDIYKLYQRAFAAAEAFRPQNYIPQYVIPNIERNL